MNEEELKDIIKVIEVMPNAYYVGTQLVFRKEPLKKLLDAYEVEKAKNNELIEITKNARKMYDSKCKIVDNLAQAIRFMSTNEKLTVEDIIKEFSKENKVTEEFMERWEKSQHEESNLKDKVIDMIASDYIQDYLYDERSDYPCEFFYGEIKKKDSCKQGKIDVCEECLKEYYFKVAKGEEYKNKYCGGED